MFGRAVPEFQPAPGVLQEARATFTTLVQEVAAAQSAGHVQTGDPGQLALYLWGLAHGLVMIELAQVTPPQAEGDPARSFRLAVNDLLAASLPDRAGLRPGPVADAVRAGGDGDRMRCPR